MNLTISNKPLGEYINADNAFRIARILVLFMAIILPWEAVTAVRENALMALLASLSVFYYLNPTARSKLRPTVLLIPLLFYALCAVISLFSAVDLNYSLKELRSEIIKGLVIFYCAVHFVQGEKELRQSWQALLFGMAIMASLGIVLFFKEGGSLFGYAFRAGSLHEGYGGMATYLALVWPFVLLAPRSIKLQRYQWALYGLIPFTLFISYLTYSRMAWITMLVESGLILFLLSKKRLKTACAAVVLFILAIVVVFNLPGSRHGETWTNLFENPQQVGGTAGDLIALWDHSYREIKKSPFRGIGLGRSSFDKAYPDFRATHQPLLFHAHNMFVDITLQMGIQGLVAILGIIGVLWAVLWPWRPPRANDLFANYKTAAVVSLIGFCLRNMTDDFFVKDSALLFWLIMGLALGAKTVLGKDKSGAA